jgi:hypothetical protein
MEAQAINLVSEKQAAAALLGGDADGGGLAQLAGGAASLEAELARSIAADEAVVDVSKLFRQTAQASADFTSGWATGEQVNEATIKAVPLANLVGKRFYHKDEAHQVVDYGPLDEASYQAKNLVSGAVELLPAEIVERAKDLVPDAPLTLNQRVPRQEKQAALALPDVPLLAGYHSVKRRHPKALALVERGDFFYAYGEDAKRVAETLNAVLDAWLVEGIRVEQTAIPAKDIDLYASRLSQAGFKVALARQKSSQKAAPPASVQEHPLPATLAEAYARFREVQKPDALTFVEMADAFVSFEGDAIAASLTLHKPHNVRALPGGPSLQVLSLPKGSHDAAFKRLQKGSAVALANGDVRLLAPEPSPETPQETSPKAPLYPRRSREQLRVMSQGQLALL